MLGVQGGSFSCPFTAEGGCAPCAANMLGVTTRHIPVLPGGDDRPVRPPSTARTIEARLEEYARSDISCLMKVKGMLVERDRT